MIGDYDRLQAATEVLSTLVKMEEVDLSAMIPPGHPAQGRSLPELMVGVAYYLADALLAARDSPINDFPPTEPQEPPEPVYSPRRVSDEEKHFPRFQEALRGIADAATIDAIQAAKVAAALALREYDDETTPF